jgi:hypothetical protein
MTYMSDTHESPTLPRNVDHEHPYAGLEQFLNVEVDWRNLRSRGYAKVAVGLAGLLVDLMLASAVMNGVVQNFSVGIVGLIAIAIASISSLWLLEQGFADLRNTRSLPPSHRYRSIRGSRQEKSAERQLLEVLERNGEITPARAALQTSLTVEEAEQLLSDLAQKDHLDVRVEGSKLVYAL